jgi:hypothetical protein
MLFIKQPASAELRSASAQHKTLFPKTPCLARLCLLFPLEGAGLASDAGFREETSNKDDDDHVPVETPLAAELASPGPHSRSLSVRSARSTQPTSAQLR